MTMTSSAKWIEFGLYFICTRISSLFLHFQLKLQYINFYTGAYMNIWFSTEYKKGYNFIHILLPATLPHQHSQTYCHSVSQLISHSRWQSGCKLIYFNSCLLLQWLISCQLHFPHLLHFFFSITLIYFWKTENKWNICYSLCCYFVQH